MSRRHHLGLWMAVSYLGLLVLVAIFAPWLTPHDPLVQDVAHPFGVPNMSHWLGTDNLGRDVASRLMVGASGALGGMLIAVATATFVGVPWGATSGYFAGAVDATLMRVADAVLVFPGLVLALVLTSVVGPGLATSMVAIGLVYSPILARVTRSGVLAVRSLDYVQLTRLYGLSGWYRIWCHVLPNASSPIIVQVTLLMGLSLLAQIGLGFLGVGIQPPKPSWGGALAESFPYLIVSPEISIAPGVVVVLTILSIYRVGDYLRDRLAHE